MSKIDIVVNTLISAGERIAELERENAELRRDAERYRYLRSIWKRDHFSTEAQPDGNPTSCDAAIDAAMKENGNG